MDGIQHYAGPPGGSPARFSGPHHPAHGTAPAKAPSDYLHALRRRIWLVLIAALVVGATGSVWTLRRPNIYRVSAQILIEPPQFDAILTSIVSHNVGRHDAETIEKYVPNRLALLRSRDLANRVVVEPSLARPQATGGDPALELYGQIQTRQLPGTNFFDVTLEGRDPARVTLLLNTALNLFKRDAADENTRVLEDSKKRAERSLSDLRGDLKRIDDGINTVLAGSAIFAPGGKNLLQDQYLVLNSVLMQKRFKHDDLVHQSRIADLFPHFYRSQLPPTPQDAEIADLLKYRKLLTQRAYALKRTIKPSRYNTDPGSVIVTRELARVMKQLDELRSIPKETAPDLAGLALDSAGEEIHKLDREVKVLLQRLQESMPDHQRYLTLLEQREQLVQRIGTMEAKLSDFEILRNSRKAPVTVVLNATEPTLPAGPNRPLYLAVVAFLGVAAGVFGVCLLEYLDHSVKAPEQLTAGLKLPLFGVIPRMRRLAQVHRGGHLWTPGSPGSLEADAFRNLRASLLGASGPRGPIKALLVTSAKPGEGKSTTALNLAATCARAGERTLLLDVDLRRPSLAEVFDDDTSSRLGLVDILHGDLPWQRTVVRTDIPNLDFLPTGETQDVPIEILGTLELRQLLIALSRHYDRVILDGPAVLGMADCRMVGRIVDAALLVVRCGAHDLRPLRRAKEMLEQSQVLIAGLVFNGLAEDLKNWSCYGAHFAAGEGSAREFGPSRGLPGPSDADEADAMAAGVYDT